MNVTLLVPAYNEENAIARTAGVMRESLEVGLVDAAYVVDGGSSDATISIARTHGIAVLRAPELSVHLGPVLGKGDALFRAVHAVDAQWYVFLDADIGNVSIDHVRPLVVAARSGRARFVKGGFVRIDEHGRPRDVPGGRVTEEVGRPLLSQVDAFLASFTQPLSGQVAVDADLARTIPFATGYGLEIAMLIDVWRTVGRQGMVEVDMGRLHNRWKTGDDLLHVREEVVAGAAIRGVIPTSWSPHQHSRVVLRTAEDA